MRHTFGFLLGVLLTPALVYGAAWGYAQAGDSFDPAAHDISDRTRMYGSLAVFAAVGLVMGVIVLARWASPLVSLIPALTLVGWSVYFLVDPAQALQLPGRVPPAGILDRGMNSLLGSGVYTMMGFALLVPMWAPGRWAGRRDESESLEERQNEYF